MKSAKGKYPVWEVDPPEVKALLAKYNGVTGDAEKAAGLYAGALSKFRTGSERYGDYHKTRVIAALEDRAIPKTLPLGFVPPATCPKLMADLLIKAGSKRGAAKMLGTSEANVYAIIDGTREMLPAWTTRAKAALGLPMVGAPIEGKKMSEEVKSAVAALPEFVAWDGSKGNVEIRGRGGKKGRTIKNVPIPIVKLVEKFGGVTPAATAIGCAGNTLTDLMEHPAKFNEKWQQRMHAGLHGAPPREEKMGLEFDRYELGLAICLLKTAAYDHIADIAELLNARLCFRKSTTAGWIVIYRMKTEDLPKFKKIGIRDANEIVCP